MDFQNEALVTASISVGAIISIASIIVSVGVIIGYANIVRMIPITKSAERLVVNTV